MGTGVPASSPEDTLSWQALTVLPHQTFPPTPPSHLLCHSFGSPSRFIAVPPAVCPLGSARPARHGTASPVIVVPSAAWADAPRQKPMQQGPARCHKLPAFAHRGINTHSLSYHPALEDTRPSDAQTAEVRLDSKPPRTPHGSVPQHRGHRPVHVAPPTFRQPWGGRGLGPGASESQMLFLKSWNLFLLTQPWGLSGRVLPNLRYVLEGCLVGPPQGSGGGAHSGTQSSPLSPSPSFAPDGA